MDEFALSKHLRVTHGEPGWKIVATKKSILEKLHKQLHKEKKGKSK